MAEPDAPAVSRSPRFVLRFALVTALGLAIGGAGILLFVRHDAIAQAEQSVKFQAQFLARSSLAGELNAGDLSAPVTGQRKRRLDSALARHVLTGGTIGVAVYAPGGRLRYSDLSAAARGSVDLGRLDAAVHGRTSTKVTSIRDGSLGTVKVLEAYVPMSVGAGSPGALLVDQDYGPISSAAWHAFVPVAGVLEAVLLALYMLLLPLLSRTSKRLTRQMEQIEHQAHHDALTGLPNRTLLRQRLGEELAADDDESGIALFLLDLDRFKEINDTLGHESGDSLLHAVGERLEGLAGDAVMVARLGGDEFAVLYRLTQVHDQALLVADRLQRGLEQPFPVAGMSLEVEASIGIALHPEHGTDVETLMRHADIAMYRSKETRAPQIYSAASDHYSTRRLALMGELRRAIADGDLVVYYQPRVDMATGEVSKVEALARWRHPHRGLLPAADFLPLAEHSGLARPLTRYVLESALRQCRGWSDAGLGLGVAVNLFARDLLDLSLPAEASTLLARLDLEPERLEFEITENTILTDPSRARSILDRLHQCGVGIAVDDFGTGYSSLDHLSRLPVNVLKIDKSFVQRMSTDLNDDVIVRSTIDLGHNLGLEVVAEGVASRELWDRLADLGCDTAQGFYVGRPMPGELVDGWIAAWYDARVGTRAA